MKPLLKLEDVGFSYEGRRVLQRVSLSIARGELDRAIRSFWMRQDDYT